MISHLFQLARVAAFVQELKFRIPALNLFSAWGSCKHADCDNHYDAEQEHPSAEKQPVHIIEQILEGTA